LIYYLLSTYVNIDVVYSETNLRNRLIYILTYMGGKNKILCNSRDWVTIASLISNNVSEAAKSSDILVSNLSVLHNYFDNLYLEQFFCCISN